MINRPFLAEKLKLIRVCLCELGPLLKTSFEVFRSKPSCYRLAERNIQLIVDSAVDANNHLLVAAKRSPPAKYFDSFIELGATGAIPGPLARRLARSTGLRNRLVHEYERVDLRIVHRHLPRLMRDYEAYLKRLRRYAGL
jgi:uncharacterized protein YutE (UPF0331/DUF86 family)